jgi:hypothetical protein
MEPCRTQAPSCDVVRPDDIDVQRVAAMLFAEAAPDRETDEEREAIAWVVVNRRAHNARYRGDGMGGTDIRSILTAPGQFTGYRNVNWNRVTTPDDVLRGDASLRALPQTITRRKKKGGLTSCESFKHCIDVARRVLSGAAPSDPLYAELISYQRASYPGSWRWEHAVQIGEHHFCRWKEGHEDPANAERLRREARKVVS